MSNPSRSAFLVIVIAATLAACARHPAASPGQAPAAAASPATSQGGPASPPGTAASGAPVASLAGSAGRSAGSDALAVPPPQPDVMFLASSAFDGCTAPTPPADPPAGDHATRAQMLASQAQAKAFDTATNAYLACLDKAAHDFEGQYGRTLTVANLRQLQATQVSMHNSAVDSDQAVAGRFNRQLHIFQARNH